MNPLGGEGVPKVCQEIKDYVSNMSNEDKVQVVVAAAICAIVIGSVVALFVTMPPVTAALASLLLIKIGIVALVILFLAEKGKREVDEERNNKRLENHLSPEVQVTMHQDKGATHFSENENITPVEGITEDVNQVNSEVTATVDT